MPIQVANRRENGYGQWMKASGSRRGRRRHVQQELFKKGGKRKGAGRKPKGSRPGTSHRKRPEVKLRHPLHVVLRVVPAVGSLRRRKMYQAMRDATLVAALRERIRIVHLSLQRNHVHLLVEAEDKLALSRGLQGLLISAARNINTMLGDGRHRRRRGRVFADRYFAEAITSPRHARHVLSYVINNWRKHGEDRDGEARTWLVDPFSSGISFPDWQELEGRHFMWPIRETYEPLIVRRPRSWLLREAWKQHGPISAHDVPSRPSTVR
jgi:REP element-mobilizing transposase RayT